MLRWVCFGLIVAGGVIMVAATLWFYRFIRQNRKESYGSRPGGHAAETMAVLAMLFFIVGFFVGGYDVATREVEPIYLFVSIVFFVGAVFIAAMVRVQMVMAKNLKAKTTEVMRGFVNSIELKDAYTQGHSWHVYHIVKLFCKQLPPAMRHRLNEPKLLDAALLHDVGKMGVADEILNKKGPLSDEEWEAIRTHPAQGQKILADTCFAEIGEWVLYHHERADGKGYYGGAGGAIPLEAKIIAVADAYSAMTTDREYRPKRSHEKALDIMRGVAGTQLDAELVALFCTIDAAELQALEATLRKR